MGCGEGKELVAIRGDWDAHVAWPPRAWRWIVECLEGVVDILALASQDITEKVIVAYLGLQKAWRR